MVAAPLIECFANTYPAVSQQAGQHYLDAAPLSALIIELNLSNPAFLAGFTADQKERREVVLLGG
jgi:hypothetical protein